MKRVTMLGLILALALTGLPPVLQSSPLTSLRMALDPPSKPTIYVDPPRIVNASMVPGCSFSVDVRIRDAVEVFAWEVDIVWDAAFLEVVSFSYGDFLADDPNDNFNVWADLEVGNEDGYFWLAASLFGPDVESVDGDGLLCTLTFRVKAPGETVLDLATGGDVGETGYVDSEGNKAGVRKENGYVCTITKLAVEDWPTFQYDNTRAGYTSTAAPNQNFTLWTYMAGGHMDSSPAVVSGRVYFSARNRTTFDDGTVFCLNASTGAHVWNYTEGGVMWSPTVAGDRVYVGGGREWYTTLFCFNASTGTLLWRYETDNDIASAAPAVAYGQVYVGDRDGWFYCLDAVTGTLRWRYRAGGDINNDFDLSAPAVVEGRVYVGCQDHQLYCFDALSGSLCWAFTSGGVIDSSPAVVDGKVYVGSVDAKVYCLDASTGTQIWDYTTDGYVISSPAIAHGRVYVGSGGSGHRLYCLNATTGAHIWSYETHGAVYGSPSVAGTRVYVGSYDTHIYCLEAETGAVLWTYKTGDYVFSSPAIADGHVYIGSFDSNLYAFGNLITMNPFDVNGRILHVSVESNSQISDVSLDQPLETISFTATGTPGTPAFVNITIPNALLESPDSVLADGLPVTTIKTSNTTHTSLYFKFIDDLHSFRIVGDSGEEGGDGRIQVDPQTLDWGGVPVDYPKIYRTLTINNTGTGPLTIESVAMIDDSEGAFNILAHYPSSVSPLDPGETGFVITGYVDPEGRGLASHSGIMQIMSNDPVNRTTNVTLLANPAPATGVTTLVSLPTLASEAEGNFDALIDPDGNITEYSVSSLSNIGHHTAELISDNRISIRGQVANRDTYAQMILEVKSTSSPEKLEIYDIIIVPFHLSDQYPIPEGFYRILPRLTTAILLSSLLFWLTHHRSSQPICI